MTRDIQKRWGTQNQAFNALLFLYRKVLQIDIDDEIQAVRAKKGRYLPSVMTRDEVMVVVNLMSGEPQLVAKLLYGCGLRLMECLRLRIKDIDFNMSQIIVREGKGAKDRATVLPEKVKPELNTHLEIAIDQCPPLLKLAQEFR